MGQYNVPFPSWNPLKSFDSYSAPISAIGEGISLLNLNLAASLMIAESGLEYKATVVYGTLARTGHYLNIGIDFGGVGYGPIAGDTGQLLKSGASLLADSV